jgi:hypothetical protein
LSEGLLAALPGYKGPDVKNNQKWLVRESMLTRQGEAIRRKPDLVVGGF